MLQARDECIVMNGEELCKEFIEAHKVTRRMYCVFVILRTQFMENSAVCHRPACVPRVSRCKPSTILVVYV